MTAATIDKRSEMTAREYAVSLGLAKMGRGRMSPLAKAAIGKAEKEGVTFKLPAHVIAQMEREANPKRVRKGKKPVNAETDAVDFRGNPNPPDPYDPGTTWCQVVWRCGHNRLPARSLPRFPGSWQRFLTDWPMILVLVLLVW